jgi:hypothetical protein
MAMATGSRWVRLLMEKIDGDFSLQHAIILAACSRPGFHGGLVCAGVQRAGPQKGVRLGERATVRRLGC